jgi:hypothetical protein
MVPVDADVTLEPVVYLDAGADASRHEQDAIATKRVIVVESAKGEEKR